MQLVKVIYITLMLCLFTFGANGQENIRENHIKLKNDSSRILFDKVCMPFNKTDLLLPNPNAKDVETAIDNTNFKTDRPFYIPPYYINPTPMFYGDYSTSGHIFSHFYGSGSQTTLLGIGRINEASIMFHHQFNNYFETRLGVNATKYYFPKSTGQAFGIYGAMIYHPNERLRLKAFGAHRLTSMAFIEIHMALLPGMILQTGWKWKSAYKIITIRRKVGMWFQ